jgi:hypothetical protein
MAKQAFDLFFEKEKNARNIAFIGIIQNLSLKRIPMLIRLWIEATEVKTVADIVRDECPGTIFDVGDDCYLFAGMYNHTDEFDQDSMLPMFNKVGQKTLTQLNPELEVRRVF